MKRSTRLIVFVVVGVLLAVLLVLTVVPSWIGGSVQVFPFALFVVLYVTVFSLLLVYINHRDPGSWRAYFALSAISVPFVVAAFILFDFNWFTLNDSIYFFIVALVTYILLWLIQPVLEKRFPKKSEKEIVFSRRGDDSS